MPDSPDLIVSSPDLIVSGPLASGAVAVSTDALRAESERLRALSLALPVVALRLRGVAGIAGPAEAVALGSWRAREADAAIAMVRTQLVIAIEECTQIADALDAAAIEYARAEREATDRFIAIAEGVAATGGSIMGEQIDRNPALARLLALLLALAARAQFGEAIGPADIELPDGVNALLSDPRFARALRSLVMTGDDFVNGVAPIPPSLRDSTSDVGIAALVIMAVGSLGGLFSGAPVTTVPVGPARPTTPATSVADRAARIPNAVAGDVPQVRIERYTAPGVPDRFEVYIGGTVDFSPLAKDEPFDLTSNLEMEAGLPSGAAAGVQRAMELAGITAESAVILTGHSQGGLVASVLAASGEYRVEGLVTFGAPAGQVDIPGEVPTLIVENLDDMVPALGGIQANREALIVQSRAYPGDLPPGLALPAHRIEAYLATAKSIDERAQSGEVVGFRERLAVLTSGYEEVSAQHYLVRRES